MTKKVFLMLILATAGMTGVNAQVRIGGNEAPNKSAVLDLNPDNDTLSGNAALGLALPRVNLRNSGDAFPLISHVKGMTVYNMAITGDINPGMYINNGAKWLRQADTENLKQLALLAEKDSIVGNEIINATGGGGLTRSGLGTAASPYTLGIAPGGVTNTHLANNVVTSAKIADGAVATAELANNSVTSEKIAFGAIKAENLNSMGAISGQTLRYNGATWEPKSSSDPKFLGILSATVSVPAGVTEVNYAFGATQYNAIGMIDTDYSKRYFGLVTSIGAYPALTSFNINYRDSGGDSYFYPYIKLKWETAFAYSFQTQVYVLIYEY